MIQAVAKHLAGRVAGYQIEDTSRPLDAQQYAFHLKLASVQIKAIDAQALIAQATVQPADAHWLGLVYAEGTAAYVDIAPVAAPLQAGDGS